MHDLSASDNRLPHARWGCIQHQLPKFAALRGWGVERNGAAGATRARTSARVAPARQPNQQGTTPHEFTPDFGVTWLAVTAHGSWQDARHTTVGREMIILAHRGNLHACPAPSRALSLTTPARATCHARAPCSPPSPAWTPLPLRTGVPQEEAWGGLQIFSENCHPFFFPGEYSAWVLLEVSPLPDLRGPGHAEGGSMGRSGVGCSLSRVLLPARCWRQPSRTQPAGFAGDGRHGRCT